MKVGGDCDRFFDPTRIPMTDKAQLIVQTITESLETYEKQLNLKKRRRRTNDQAVFTATMTALVCDLAHYHLSKDERNLVIPRSKRVLGKRDRYNHPAFNQKLPEWLDLLSTPELGWINQVKGFGRIFGPNQRTIISPASRFLDILDHHQVLLSDFAACEATEVIQLKEAKEGYGKKGKLKQYDDTPEIIKWREEITSINEWLAKADIEFDRRVMKRVLKVDPQERSLRRSFTCGSFRSGGRLWGGFWMILQKEERLEGLRINGEPVVSLDYGQTAPRILYGVTGATPLSEDLYDIPGIEPRYREGIKAVMSALTFSDKILFNKPKDKAQVLPKKKKIGEICDLIIKAHPGIAEYLPSQKGHELQFLESEILIAVMLDLMGKGIVSLPIHDCVLVPESCQEIAHSVMLSEFRKVAGIDVRVSVEKATMRNKESVSSSHSLSLSEA